MIYEVLGIVLPIIALHGGMVLTVRQPTSTLTDKLLTWVVM